MADSLTSTDKNFTQLAALALLQALRRHGVEYFFCNPGTDFPAIIEAFSLADADPALKESVPKPIVVPHENAAVAMAHGAYLVTGRPQAVMVHVNVGTANTVNGAANASRDQAPILLLAGRTPITETGLQGSRNRNIHWAQDMFDQAGMLREFVKWDHELKLASETQSAVTRAMEMMLSSPRGPAYLSLPREVLGGQVRVSATLARTRAVAAAPWPDPGAIDTLADWIASAKQPLVITSASGRTSAGFNALSSLAQLFAIPVVAVGGRYVCLSTEHEMHMGFQPKALLEKADLVIVLECDVPWLPSLEGPPADCRVAHIAEDPAFVRYPTRGFAVDLSIKADCSVALSALEQALIGRLVINNEDMPGITARRASLATQRAKLRTSWQIQGDAAAADSRIKPEWISHCLDHAVGKDAIIVNEYPLRLEHCKREKPGTFFGLSPAGGLGWGLGAALGIKLSAPDALVVATLGDGAYMFDNPTACHWVSCVQKLPILILIYNNQMYGAVRNSTAAMYPDGASASSGFTLLADLGPSPAFEKIVEASGGYGECVNDPSQLPAALQRALHAVTQQKRQALLNIVCQY